MWKSRVMDGCKGPRQQCGKSRVVELVLNEFYLHLLRDMLSKEWLENSYRNNEPTANFYFRHK